MIRQLTSLRLGSSNECAAGDFDWVLLEAGGRFTLVQRQNRLLKSPIVAHTHSLLTAIEFRPFAPFPT